jgi:predicted nucleic acid-binding protein
VARGFPGIEAIVPALWHLEIANVFLTGERRKRSSAADTAAWLGFLGALPITVDEETVDNAWADTLELARVHHLSVYDAAYLELARRRRLPLATLDARLRTAAIAAGVREYTPA